MNYQQSEMGFYVAIVEREGFAVYTLEQWEEITLWHLLPYWEIY